MNAYLIYKRAKYMGVETNKAILFLFYSRDKNNNIERIEKFIPKKFIVGVTPLTLSKWAHDNIMSSEIKAFMKPKMIRLPISYNFNDQKHYYTNINNKNEIRNYISESYSPENSLSLNIEKEWDNFTEETSPGTGIDFAKLTKEIKKNKPNHCAGCGIDLKINYETWCFHPEGCGKMKKEKGIEIIEKQTEKKVTNNKRAILF